MFLSCPYKVRHSNKQLEKLSVWLDMLKTPSNWCWRDRIEDGNQEFIQVDYCDLKTQVGITRLTGRLVRNTKLDNPGKTGECQAKKTGEKDKSPKRSASLMQEANLINLKASRPWYRNIDAAVLQSIPARFNESFNKFFNGGFPKFKSRHDFKSFSYKPGHVKIKGSKIYLPKIGWMRLKVTALHNKIQQKREAYLWWVANKLIKKYDAVAAEELPLENMMKRCQPIKSNTGRCLPNNQSAKRGLNRSLSDASWYYLTKKLEYLAAKSGKRLDKVNPQYTSKTCSKCSHIDRDSHNGKKFICTNCGHIDDGNLQAARNVKTKAIKAYGLTIVKKIRAKMVRVDCSKPVQLNLCEIELCEGLPDNTLPQKGSVACGREPRWHSIVCLGC